MISRSVSDRNWILKKFDENKVKRISQSIGISELLSRLLSIRGIDEKDCLSFLNPKIKNLMPNPYSLKSMTEASDIVIEHIKKKSKICIFGDYDVDGASSSSILGKFFTQIGLEFIIFIPDRIKDGYGPTVKTFSNIINKGVKLIIAVDCGTTAFDAIDFANEKDVDVVIVDHHQSTEVLPKAKAIVNPNRFDENSELTYLCAAGVTFLFLAAIVTKLRKEQFFNLNQINEPDILNYLDLVTLGTVCDVVPLRGLNRAFVTQGLKVIAKRQNIGIKTLADLSNINSKISTYHIGYILGPKINAGGRIGKSEHGTNLLLTNDAEKAFSISKELEEFNEKRKNIENIMLEEAINLAKVKDNNPVIVLTSNAWHEGVIGIIASRLKDKFNKPVFIVCFDGNEGKGSARSVPGFDIGTAIVHSKQLNLISRGGGHKMAAGFSINKENVDRFEKLMIELFDKSECLSSKENDLFIDSIISPSALNEDFYDEINQLAPFGSANLEPRFMLENVSIIKTIKLKNNHIKAISKVGNNTINVVSFNSVDTVIGTYLENHKNKKFNLAGRLSLNEWNGKKEVQFLLDDLSLFNN